jgi:hypothetical protein
MKKVITLSMIIMLFALNLQAQEDKPKDLPVRAPFESGILIDNQTTVIPTEKTLEYNIQHKFSPMSNGFSDLFGIYAPGANMRMSFSYVPYKNLQVGYGLSLQKMFSDFSLKYTILEQTRKNTVPVAVAIYANMAIDGRNEEAFGTEYSFSNRYAYFTQLIIGRKITETLSVQANASYTHYNAMEYGYDHDRISVGFNGRFNFSPQSSILFQYDQPLFIESMTEYREDERKDLSKPNLGVGWEIRTSTHVFHIYVSSAKGIIPQENAMYNTYDIGEGDLMFGFSMIRLWNF